MPVDLTLPTFPLPPVAAEFHTQMETMKVAVQARIEDQQDYSVNYHNKFRREVTYEPGDLVLLHNPSTEVCLAKKFTQPYRGPFCVMEETSPVNFLLESTRGKYRQELTHVSRMKPYYERKTILLKSDHESETSESSQFY